VELDDRDLRGGEKYWQWIKKGVPVTLEVGPRDLESDSAFVGRRDVGRSGREGMTREDFLGRLPDMLQDIQDKLFERALAFREENTSEIDSKEEFYEFFSAADTGAQGGFAMVHWDGDVKWEEQVKNDLKVTVRCIPQGEGESGTCIFSGNPSPRRVVFALAY
jgi:prolyl-tRNA synthetase